jgi:hypothetical protein
MTLDHEQNGDRLGSRRVRVSTYCRFMRIYIENARSNWTDSHPGQLMTLNDRQNLLREGTYAWRNATPEMVQQIIGSSEIEA